MIATYSHYLERTDDLLDAPTVRGFRRLLPDLTAALEALPQLEAVELAVGGPSGTDVWRDHLERVVNHWLPTSGQKPETGPLELRQEKMGPPKRQIECARDPRMPTFSDTRSYSRVGELAANEGELSRHAFEMVCVQRDELDAIETFANVMFDMQVLSFGDFAMLGRLIDDEARHAEIGMRMIEESGRDHLTVPCSTIGIKVRSPLDPIIAFAQINLFGELSIVGALGRLSREAYRYGEDRIGLVFDFIHADELTHVRRGRDWLKRASSEHGLDELEEAARFASCERLAEEGVVGEDYALTLTRSEIFALMGE